MCKQFVVLIALLLLAVSYMEARNCPSQSGYSNILGESVSLKEIGVHVGCYHYAVTTDNRTFTVPGDAAGKLDLAFSLGYKLFVNQFLGSNHYSVTREKAEA